VGVSKCMRVGTCVGENKADLLAWERGFRDIAGLGQIAIPGTRLGHITLY
jgi:hypothetical protein